MINCTFISGATGGIGKAFTIACAKKKYNLFLTGRSAEKLFDLKEELKDYDVEIDYFACDLTSELSRGEMVEYIKGKGYKFDKIINVAGVDTQKPFSEYTLEKLLFQVNVNVVATTALTFQLLKLKSEKTEVITVASMSGATPMPYFAVYSASKAYLINLSTALRTEYKKQGVKFTCVLPGGVPTRPDIIEDIKKQGLWGKLSNKSPEFVAEKSLKAVKKNKCKYIPGFFNKLLYGIIKIVPDSLVIKFIGGRWKNLRKDAF